MYHLGKNVVTPLLERKVLPMISKEVFMDIIAMHRNGYSIRKIAKLHGIHRDTVKRHLQSNSFPEYQKEKRKISILHGLGDVVHYL